MKQLIYKHTCNITNEAYIGQTIKTMEERLRGHLYNVKNNINSHFYNAIKKYGIKNFTSEILEDNIKIQSDLKTKKTLADEREIYWIEYYNTFSDKGYNMTKGGDGTLGRIVSEETRKKLSQNNNKYWKGKNFSDEHKRKLNENKMGMLGKKHSEETKKKQSEVKKGNNNPMYGNSPSDETRKKLSESHRGKNHYLYGGKKQKTVTCPHCGKDGGNTMTRWHFDNCKYKDDMFWEEW